MRKKIFKFMIFVVFLSTYQLINLPAPYGTKGSFTGSTVSYAAGVGTSAADFLKLGPNARAVALGNAYVAVADEASAIYWNPAGLGQLRNKEFTASYLSYVEGIHSGFLGFIYPRRAGVCGIGLNYLTTSIERVKELDASLGQPLYEKDGEYTAGAFVLFLSYARRISNNLSLGLNLKVINEKLDDRSANAYALDFGSLWWKILGTPLRLGFNIQNLGTKLASDSLPLNFKLGIAYSLLAERLLTGLDCNYSLDEDLRIALGVEYCLKEMFFFRAGYEYGNDLSNLSGGLGMKYRGYNFDYSIVPYKDFGLAQRLSLSKKF